MGKKNIAFASVHSVQAMPESTAMPSFNNTALMAAALETIPERGLAGVSKAVHAVVSKMPHLHLHDVPGDSGKPDRSPVATLVHNAVGKASGGTPEK